MEFVLTVPRNVVGYQLPQGWFLDSDGVLRSSEQIEAPPTLTPIYNEKQVYRLVCHDDSCLGVIRWLREAFSHSETQWGLKEYKEVAEAVMAISKATGQAVTLIVRYV